MTIVKSYKISLEDTSRGGTLTLWVDSDEGLLVIEDEQNVNVVLDVAYIDQLIEAIKEIVSDHEERALQRDGSRG